MKKLFVALLITVLCFSLFACSESDSIDSALNAAQTLSTSKNSITSIQTARYEAVSAPMTNGPIVMDSATDNEYNYYLLDLGYIKNVPLSSGTSLYYNGNTPISIAIEKKNITEKSVTNALSKAVSQTVSETSMGSASVSIQQSVEYGAIFVGGETTLGASYSRQWGTVQENSYATTDTYQKVESTIEEMSVCISLTIGEHNEPSGYYNMSLTGTCDVFAMVQTSLDNSEVLSLNYYLTARDDTNFVPSYSTDGCFDSSSDNKIDLPDNFQKSLPRPIKSIDSFGEDLNEPTYEKISITKAPTSCALDNNFSTSKGANGDDATRHNGFNLGTLNIYGCMNANNKYLIGDKEGFALRYSVSQNTEDLPRVDTGLTKLADDTCSKVAGTNINSAIGFGAYWVRITYTDDSQTQYNKTNIFKYAYNGTNIDIVAEDDYDTQKEIKKIEVTIVYEFYCGGPGFLGIWWNEYTNWRIDYTFDFVG